MTNEQKARELAKCSTCFRAKWCKGIEGDCCDEFEHLLAMAQWKDEQEVDGTEILKEMKEKLEHHLYMSKKMSNLINNVLNTINQQP